MKLNYKKHGSGPPLIILHGMLGSLDNWQTLGLRFGEAGFETWIVDQRNHGHSPWADEWSYETMAADLKTFIQDHKIAEPAVLGHSMGGKTAMHLAVRESGLIKKLIVADIAPKEYPAHHDDIIDGLVAVDLSEVTSRKDADKALSKHIRSLPVRQFLLKNLKRKENDTDRFEWRFNLAVIEKQYDNVRMDTIKGHYPGPTLFIRGSKSNYISESDLPEIKQKFPQATLETLDAGHWLHAEQPDAFFDIVSNFLKSK